MDVRGRKALQLRPSNAGYQYNLGTALSAQGKWAEAEKELTRLQRDVDLNKHLKSAMGLRRRQRGGDGARADSEEDAFSAACPLLEEYQKMFAPLGFVHGATPDLLGPTMQHFKAW